MFEVFYGTDKCKCAASEAPQGRIVPSAKHSLCIAVPLQGVDHRSVPAGHCSAAEPAAGGGERGEVPACLLTGPAASLRNAPQRTGTGACWVVIPLHLPGLPSCWRVPSVPCQITGRRATLCCWTVTPPRAAWACSGTGCAS